MSSIVRIVLGVVVLILAFVFKQKGTPAADAGEDTVQTLMMFGNEVSPSTLNLIVAVIAIIGVVMIGLGAMGMLKNKR